MKGSAASAIRAEPIRSGDVPNAFDNRTRTASPPRLTCAISRKV